MKAYWVNNKRLASAFKLFRDLEIFATDHSLSFDAFMILLLLRDTQEKAAKEIISTLGLHASKTTRCMKELTRSELIDEYLDEKDLRKCYFRISSKGSNVAYGATKRFGEEAIDALLYRYSVLKKALRDSQAPTGFRLTDTSQRLLLVLHAADQPVSVGKLCKITGLPQSRVSMTLASLRNEGLIGIEQTGIDNRVHNHEMTEKGNAKVSQMLSKIHQY